MAKLIIDITKEDLRIICERTKREIWEEYGGIDQRLMEAVQNGTLLPKGHGRLIDADAVNKKMKEREEKLQDDRSMWEGSAVSVALDMFAPTIIEADKGE